MKTLKAILALAVSAGLLAATAARADEWHDHEMHAHEWRHHHHHPHGPVIVQEPNVVYAPPIVVESPPPPVEDSPSGLNLVFPINIH
jgi:hypothetical protein